MSKTDKAVAEISLTDGFRAVVVTGPNIRVEVVSGGDVNVATGGHAPAAPTISADALRIGARMADGSVYAGISPDSGKPMFTTTGDARLFCTFDEAAGYAKKLDACGHSDWRVPTKNELNVLYWHHPGIGDFDTSGSRRSGWYWSSSETGGCEAWAQCFKDGRQNYYARFHDSALRCVRG